MSTQSISTLTKFNFQFKNSSWKYLSALKFSNFIKEEISFGNKTEKKKGYVTLVNREENWHRKAQA